MRPNTHSATPAAQRDEWRTPRAIVDYVARAYGCSIDTACTPENTVFPMYIVSDALRMPWRFGSHPSVCYCNPPYSNIDPWMAKAVEQLEFGVTTVMLAPSPNGESRFPKHVFGVCSEIVFISPRVSFLRPDGSVARGNSRGSCLYVWSPYFPGGQTAMRFVSIPT